MVTDQQVQYLSANSNKNHYFYRYFVKKIIFFFFVCVFLNHQSQSSMLPIPSLFLTLLAMSVSYVGQDHMAWSLIQSSNTAFDGNTNEGLNYQAM